MNESLSAFTIRPFALADIPALVAISNQHFPDTPAAVEGREHEEHTRDPARPFRQVVAECNGVVVGIGNCGLDAGPRSPDTYSCWVMVAPAQEHQGIGQRLMADLEAWVRQQRQKRLHTGCREDKLRSIRCLKAAGFYGIGRRFESALNLDTFDESRFAGLREQLEFQGIVFTTLAQETTPDADERLYRLARPLLESIPLPGGAVFVLDFNDWKNIELEHPNATRDALVIAKYGDEYIGYSNLWVPKEGPAYTAMTGVHPRFRQRGLAIALKLETIRMARRRGYHEMRTSNDTANPGILAVNERLGYRPLPGWLIWEKQLMSQ